MKHTPFKSLAAAAAVAVAAARIVRQRVRPQLRCRSNVVLFSCGWRIVNRQKCIPAPIKWLSGLGGEGFCLFWSAICREFFFAGVAPWWWLGRWGLGGSRRAGGGCHAGRLSGEPGICTSLPIQIKAKRSHALPRKYISFYAQSILIWSLTTCCERHGCADRPEESGQRVLSLQRTLAAGSWTPQTARAAREAPDAPPHMYLNKLSENSMIDYICAHTPLGGGSLLNIKNHKFHTQFI